PTPTRQGQYLRLSNFLARCKPGASERVLYLAHWDTRPHADKSPNPSDRNQPVLGANDGASGVAILLALADVLKTTPPRVGVDLLFTDGEDYGDFSDTTETLLGARHFAAHLPSGYQLPSHDLRHHRQSVGAVSSGSGRRGTCTRSMTRKVSPCLELPYLRLKL